MRPSQLELLTEKEDGRGSAQNRARPASKKKAPDKTQHSKTGAQIEITDRSMMMTF